MNNSSSAKKQYLKDEVLGASPQKLVVMLYDGVIRFLGEAIKHVDDPHVFVENVTKAEAIIAELTGAVKADKNPQVGLNLLRLYDFSYQALIKAHGEKDLKAIGEVIDLFKGLRESWAQAMESLSETEGTELTEPAPKFEKRPSLSFEA